MSVLAPDLSTLGTLALLVARLQARQRAVCHRCGSVATSDTGRSVHGQVELDYRCLSCPTSWSERLGPAEIGRILR